MAIPRRSDVKPDGKWRWVIVAACFANMFILYGLYKMSGMLFVATMGVFNENRERAAWPYTLCNSVFQCVGILAGIFAHNFGIRKSCIAGGIIGTVGTSACYFARSVLWLTIFYGFIFGFGFGVISSLIPVIVNQYFKQNKSVATGIAYSGSTCGSLVMPIVIEFVLDRYGFRGSFLIIGGLVMNLLVPSSLLRDPASATIRKPNEHQTSEFVHLTTAPISQMDPRREEDGANHCASESGNSVRDHLQIPLEDTEEVMIPPVECKQHNSPARETAKIVLAILKNPIFWMVVLSSVSFMYSIHSFYTVIIDFAVDKGVDSHDAKYLISAASLGSLGGRLTLGWVPDKKILSLKNYIMISMASFTVVIGCFPLVDSYRTLLVLVTFYGVLEGGVIIMFPVLLAHYFGRERHAISFGLMQGINGCMSFARPNMIGFFRDTIGSYDGLFYTLMSMLAVGSMIWLFEPIIRRFSPAVVTDQT